MNFLAKGNWYYHRLQAMTGYEIYWRIKRVFKPFSYKRSSWGNKKVDLNFLQGVQAVIGSYDKNLVIQYAEILRNGRAWCYNLEYKYFPFQWQKNPQTGKIIPLDIKGYKDYETVGDPKYIWEPARFWHLLQLAAAWSDTGKADYGKLLIEGLRTWREQVPIGRGIHWSTALEPAFRIWSLAQIMALAGEKLPEEIMEIAAEEIWASALFIEGSLSYGSSANNHLLGEALGLWLAGCAFRCDQKGKKWLATATRVLEQEFDYQFFNEGVSKEQAVYYHLYSMEFLEIYLKLGKVLGFDSSLKSLYQRCQDYIEAWAKTAAKIPLVGDHDGGALPLPGRLSNYYEYQKGNQGGTAGDWESRLFPNSGHYFFNIPGLGKIFCKAGPFGLATIYAHAHADQLEVLLFDPEGNPLLIDPGHNPYYGKSILRDIFRSSFYHNTVSIEGVEQAKNLGPFMWKEWSSERKVQILSDMPGKVDLTIVMLQNLARGKISHERKIKLDKSQSMIWIYDKVTNRQRESIRAHLTWILAPELVMNKEFFSGNTPVYKYPLGRNLMISLWDLQGNKPEVVPLELGLRYGVMIESLALRQNLEIGSGSSGKFITCIHLAEQSVAVPLQEI